MEEMNTGKNVVILSLSKLLMLLKRIIFPNCVIPFILDQFPKLGVYSLENLLDIPNINIDKGACLEAIFPQTFGIRMIAHMGKKCGEVFSFLSGTTISSYEIRFEEIVLLPKISDKGRDKSERYVKAGGFKEIFFFFVFRVFTSN